MVRLRRFSLRSELASPTRGEFCATVSPTFAVETIGGQLTALEAALPTIQHRSRDRVVGIVGRLKTSGNPPSATVTPLVHTRHVASSETDPTHGSAADVSRHPVKVGLVAPDQLAVGIRIDTDNLAVISAEYAPEATDTVDHRGSDGHGVC